jgi:dipeptidase
MPFYAGATELPKSFAVGDHWVFSRDSARWAFDYVDFHVQVAYSEAIQDVQAAQAVYEAETIARIPEIDRQALELYKKKPAEAARFLTAFGLNNAKTVIDAWWKLGDDLLVKYNRLYLYDTQKRIYQRSKPATPDWWKKAVRVFDILMEPDKK